MYQETSMSRPVLHLTLSQGTHRLCQHLGNRSAYVEALIRHHWATTLKAIRLLRQQGWTKHALGYAVAWCEQQHTLEEASMEEFRLHLAGAYDSGIDHETWQWLLGGNDTPACFYLLACEAVWGNQAVYHLIEQTEP